MVRYEQTNPASVAFVAAIENPGLRTDLYGSNGAQADQFITSRLGNLTHREHATVGKLLLGGLASGTPFWDESMQKTASLVFARLALRDMPKKDLNGLGGWYFQAVRKQSDYPREERAIDALLTIGVILMPHLLSQGDQPEQLVDEMRTSWGTVVTDSSSAQDRLPLSEKVEKIIDMLQNKEGVRSKDSEVAMRRGLVLVLSQQGKEPLQIHQETGISVHAIKKDRRIFTDIGLLEKRPRGAKKDPAVAKRREELLPHLVDRKKTAQILAETPLDRDTLDNDRRALREEGHPVGPKGRQEDADKLRRWEQLLPHLLLGKGPTQISRDTGIPKGTVASDRFRMIQQGYWDGKTVHDQTDADAPDSELPPSDTIFEFPK